MDLCREGQRREIGRKGIQLGEITEEIVRGDIIIEIVGTEIGDRMEAGQVEMTADPVTGMGRLIEMWWQIVV